MDKHKKKIKFKNNFTNITEHKNIEMCENKQIV